MDDARIAQFRKMAEADPGNELGHFSLGKALLDVKNYSEAIASLERAVRLAPQNSKAYQLLAQAHRGAGDTDSAIVTLRAGLDVARQRGDMMPRKEMAAMLKELGQPVPQEDLAAGSAPAASAPASEAGDDVITCRRCGQARPKMPERPFKGPLGEQVWANICTPCWREWIPMGTKVINELRLNFADPRHTEMYDQHMKEFLGLE